MAQALKAAPTANFVQKTLGAELLAGATTVTLNNTTSIRNLPGAFIVDRINNADEETPNQREVIAYTGVSGSTLTGLTRNADSSGSDQTHAINAIVEFGPDVLWAESIYDALSEIFVPSTGLVDTTKVITHTATQTMTNKTLTSPSLTTPTMTSPTVSSGDLALTSATANIQVAGADPKKALRVPASAMYGATTNGAATGQYESSSNKINVKVLDFDGTTEEYGWFNIPAPDWWDLGTVTAKFHWTAASGSGDVIWGIAGLARSNDDALDTALGTAVTVTDTLLTALDEHVTSATSAVTIGGTPAKGDNLYFRVYRDADAGGDTLNAVDARLLGVSIYFTQGQLDDK